VGTQGSLLLTTRFWPPARAFAMRSAPSSTCSTALCPPATSGLHALSTAMASTTEDLEDSAGSEDFEDFAVRRTSVRQTRHGWRRHALTRRLCHASACSTRCASRDGCGGTGGGCHPSPGLSDVISSHPPVTEAAATVLFDVRYPAAPTLVRGRSVSPRVLDVVARSVAGGWRVVDPVTGDLTTPEPRSAPPTMSLSGVHRGIAGVQCAGWVLIRQITLPAITCDQSSS
jgi:hypothetical protein